MMMGELGLDGIGWRGKLGLGMSCARYGALSFFVWSRVADPRHQRPALHAKRWTVMDAGLRGCLFGLLPFLVWNQLLPWLGLSVRLL